jgi:kumamolisin
LKPATRSRRLRAGTLLAAGTVGSMVVLATVVPASAVIVAAPGEGSSAAGPGAGVTSTGGTSTGGPGAGGTDTGGGPSAAKVAVAQGLDAAAVGAHRVFPVKGSTKETVSFVLRLRNASALKSAVEAGMPHGYLSVKAFASGYGQTRANVAALQKYLKRYGIKSTVYADRLDVSATGRASRWNKALSVTQSEYKVAAIPARGDQPARPAVTFHGTTDKPLLPKSLASFVYSILGLTNYPVASSDAVRTPTPEERSTPKGLQQGNRTPANFAKQYNLTPLQRAGAKGKGETIGIITYASLRPSDATHFWSSVLKIKTKANRIKLDNIDGGSGKVSLANGSDETTLDVEQSGALAPDANIVVYQAPNTDYGTADAWFGAASQNTAGTISTSWGQSEIFNEAVAASRTESATYGGIYDEAALEMAAQGQSAFDASGDAGAYDDVADPTPYTELSVDNPANSPWLTAAGGTTNPGAIPLYDNNGDLAATVHITAQRAWGWDYLFPYYYLFANQDSSNGAAFTSEPLFVEDTYYAGGGGGGYSVVEGQPAYQSKIKGIDDYHFVGTPGTPDFDGYVQPTDYLKYGTKTACTGPASATCLPTEWIAWPGAATNTAPQALPGTFSGPGGRAVPDIVADADPYTGYEVYFSGFPSAGLPTLFAGYGGTSFVAPQLNGSAAVIDSYLHHRTGFWNPAIYKFAASKRITPFTPLDAESANNDNLYYTGTTGAIYNPGTGLGVPNLDKLALDFRYHD